MAHRNLRTPSGSVGTAVLGAVDYTKWQAGHVTLAELANRCGVSIPAVNKRFKKLAADPTLIAPKVPDPIALVPSTPWMVPDASKPLPSFSDQDARTLAVSAAFASLVHANHFLTSNTSIAPSILKATSVATSAAVDLLVKLGAMPLPEPAEKPLPQLIVRTMTVEEEAALRNGDALKETEDDK